MSDTQYGRDLCATGRHNFEDDGPCLRCGAPLPAPEAVPPERTPEALEARRFQIWVDDPKQGGRLYCALGADRHVRITIESADLVRAATTAEAGGPAIRWADLDILRHEASNWALRAMEAKTPWERQVAQDLERRFDGLANRLEVLAPAERPDGDEWTAPPPPQPMRVIQGGDDVSGQ